MSLVIQFLSQIRNFVRKQDGDSLQSWLQVGPNSPRQYHELRAELRNQYRQSGLDNIIQKCLPDDEDDEVEGEAVPWPSLVTFIKEYFTFWRDADYDADLVRTHQLLSTLVSSCATALTHPAYGAMLLKTSMSLSDVLARLTMTLNRRPELTRQLRTSNDDESRKSIAESSAEIIQKIFTACLNDRSSDRSSPPKGKRVAIYIFANLVLKLLFACRRIHLAKMIFFNLGANSPPLSLYPAAQRVTFLYYLGRFSFSSGNHYLRAANCLEAAYLQTPPRFTSHRTNILTYLIAANILLGHFPSASLLQRPESRTLAPIFFPLCAALRGGDFIRFQAHLAEHEDWLLEKGLLVPLTHKLRPLLWRSLARKTFLLTYVPPTDSSSRKAATLDVADLHTAAVYVQRRLEGWVPRPADHAHQPSVNPLLMKALANNMQETTRGGGGTTLVPPPAGKPNRLRPNEGLVWGNAEVTLDHVELQLATLVEEGLMHGFIAHGQGRFAIIGAKAKGPVAAGWPSVWQSIQERRYEEDYNPDDVPGWVRV
uniref:PCI domain-containing protein n=1 Tax=Bionectria ochroleuca TaxID=29856 RepID=A0A8H7NNL3_BIOOC